jgi:hypothetical protein
VPLQRPPDLDRISETDVVVRFTARRCARLPAHHGRGARMPEASDGLPINPPLSSCHRANGDRVPAPLDMSPDHAMMQIIVTRVPTPEDGRRAGALCPGPWCVDPRSSYWEAAVIRLLSCFMLLGLVQTAYAADVIVDYRDSGFRDAEPSVAPDERVRLARIMAEEAPKALRMELGADFVVLGSAAGAFTRSDSRERAYLVQAKAPVASDPFPDAAAPVLVVLGDGVKAHFFRLPRNVQYQRLVAAADVDRDGRSEVLLEAGAYNMGESVTALTVVKLDPVTGLAKPEQVLRDVFTDNCDGGSGRKARTASTLSLDASTGGLVARRYQLTCR